MGDVINYRGGFSRIPVLHGGGAEGYISHRGKADEFHYGQYPDDSLDIMSGLADAYPGEYLAIWTYGHAINVLHICTRGGLVSKEVAFRIARPADKRRDPKVFNGFARWFAESAFKPDPDTLRQELEAPAVSVDRWFKAFGVEGARELDATDKDALWADFETVALDLLRGDVTDADMVNRINDLIPDTEEPLENEPVEEPGYTARWIHSAAFDLAEVIGEPDKGLWKERLRAARFYWDITDCEDAYRRITVGGDERGYGSSASLGRLLCYYPLEVPNCRQSQFPGLFQPGRHGL